MRQLIMLGIALAGAACSTEPADGPPAPAVVDAGPESAGQLAYEKFCASCHDEGVDGAPVRGRSEDWAGRSQLWQAVLFEHAQEGYLDMPAKGGTPELSDETVALAAEYILESTFSERPPD